MTNFVGSTSPVFERLYFLFRTQNQQRVLLGYYDAHLTCSFVLRSAVRLPSCRRSLQGRWMLCANILNETESLMIIFRTANLSVEQQRLPQPCLPSTSADVPFRSSIKIWLSI